MNVLVEVWPWPSQQERAVDSETGPRRPAEAARRHRIGTTGRHRRAPENAGLTTAFASGLSDSEAGTESSACAVDQVDGLSHAAAGRGAAERERACILRVLGALGSLASSEARQQVVL